MEAHYELSLVDWQKVIRELYHYLNKEKYKHKTTSLETPFRKTLFDHRNGLASTITYNFTRKVNIFSSHKFTLHIPDQTKFHSGDIRYEASKWYGINFWWVIRMKLLGKGGIESTKLS